MASHGVRAGMARAGVKVEVKAEGKGVARVAVGVVADAMANNAVAAANDRNVATVVSRCGQRKALKASRVATKDVAAKMRVGNRAASAVRAATPVSQGKPASRAKGVNRASRAKAVTAVVSAAKAEVPAVMAKAARRWKRRTAAPQGCPLRQGCRAIRPRARSAARAATRAIVANPAASAAANVVESAAAKVGASAASAAPATTGARAPTPATRRPIH